MRPIGPDGAVNIIDMSINYLRPHCFELGKQIQAIYDIREVFTHYDSSRSLVWDYETMGNPMDYSQYKNNMEMCIGHLSHEQVRDLIASLMYFAREGSHFILKFKSIQLLGELTSEPIFNEHKALRTFDSRGKKHMQQLLSAIELPEEMDPHPVIRFLLRTNDPAEQFDWLLKILEYSDVYLTEWSLKALEQSTILDLPGNRVQFVLRITELMRKMREEKVDEEWMPLYAKLKRIAKKKEMDPELPDLPSNLDHLIKAPREQLEEIQKRTPSRCGHTPRPKPDKVRGDGFRELGVYTGGKK